MNKFLPLVIAIVISVLFSGCKSTPTYRNISETEIPSFKTKLQLNDKLVYSSNFKQPTNKQEKCKILFWGYAPVSNDKQSYTVTWDGECKDGKAEGLGKTVSNRGAIETFEIGYVEQGISKNFYYRGMFGSKNVQFGQYLEGDNHRKNLDNFATVEDNGEINFLYASVETDNKTGISVGTNYKKFNDGQTKQRGYFGNAYFYGIRELYDANSVKTDIYWGYVNTSTDQPDGFVVLKNSKGLWHQRYEYGSFQEYVQLPKLYTNSLLVVGDEGAKATNKASRSGQFAIAMKKKYDAMNNATPSSRAPNNPAPVPSRSISTGTGFFISNDGYVLTNSHVIEGSSKFSIILNGKSVPATLVDHDSSNDIALLKVDKSVQGLAIELKKKAKQGSEIAVLGYPNIGMQGNEQKATFGFINANSGIQGDTRYFQISSPIQPGNSGSPMVDERGVVIGIASATLNQSAAIKSTGTLAQNVNYAVKIAYALPMLINHGVDYIEPSNQKHLKKTELIESISDSVVLVVAE